MTTQQVVIANTPKNDPRVCGVPLDIRLSLTFWVFPLSKKGGKLVGITNRSGG
jgi:hypothetical protein